MKKIFGISLMAVLSVMPMMAGAAVTDADPGATVTENAATASATPKYALKGAGDNDGKAANAAYVKGAYNAVIKGINKTKDEVDTLNTDIGTYQNAVDHLLDGKATQDGTVATIKSATSSETIQTSSVNITGVTTTSISATASGNVALSVPTLGDWENDALAANPVQTTTSFSGLAVDNLSMSAPGANNTATLTKSGIGGTVNVAEYLAETPKYDFTPLVYTGADSNSYKAISYPGGIDYEGFDETYGDYTELAPGEWKVKWNAYGTVKGIAMCSSTNGGTMGTTTTEPLSTEGDTKYCWCKMTGFTDNDGTQYNQSSLWMYLFKQASADACAAQCAHDCAVKLDSRDMESVIFGVEVEEEPDPVPERP